MSLEAAVQICTKVLGPCPTQHRLIWGLSPHVKVVAELRGARLNVPHIRVLPVYVGTHLYRPTQNIKITQRDPEGSLRHAVHAAFRAEERGLQDQEICKSTQIDKKCAAADLRIALKDLGVHGCVEVTGFGNPNLQIQLDLKGVETLISTIRKGQQSPQ